ncbi:MAG: purine/pyrimidine permease [Spirochaetales bacterium]|nr:purine/pyrimidine permease [Spirochaetales bacterium]
MQENNLTNLTGKVNVFRAFPHALQHILAMFATNLVPILTIASITGQTMSDELTLALSQNAMLIAGIATLIQSTPIWKIGSGLPIVMGMSFTFLITLVTIALTYGYPGVIGAVIIGGLFEGLLGLTARYWKRIISPIVSATVVTCIGLSLLGTATRSFGGGYADDFGAIHYLVIGFATIAACIIWQIYAKGTKKQLSILMGLTVGYIASLFFGIIVFPDFSGVKIFSLPKILPVMPEFHFDAILSICVIYLVSATETIGDVSAISGGGLHRIATSEEISGALTVDGFGSMLGGLFGVPPVTSYSENVGLTIMTGVTNRNVFRIAAGTLIFCAFFPPIGYFFRTIPAPVIGGVLLVVFGQILVSGFQMMSDAGFTTRNKLIASLSLAIGIGFTEAAQGGIWSKMPPIIQSIFSQNIVAMVFVISLFLSLVLPRKMDEK